MPTNTNFVARMGFCIFLAVGSLAYLKGVSFVSFVDGGEHRLVDPEAHGGGHQGQGQVAEHAEHNRGGKYQAENRRNTSHWIGNIIIK